MAGTRRIAALVTAVAGVSPGQRLRVEFWARHLAPHGWEVDFYRFEDEGLREILHRPGRTLAKGRSFARCYYRQARNVGRLDGYDAIYIYREAALIGPAVIERLAARTGVPVVYDLDDPTFVRYRSPTNGWASLLKFPGKERSLFKMATHVITVNGIIGEYAARYNPAVTTIPMFLDVEHYRPIEEPVGGPPRVVWSGSHSTMINVHAIAPALRRLQEDCGTPVRIVGEGGLELPGVRTELRQFQVANEVSDIQDCHVGLVPLADIPWNRWKFFFKAVQYMATGLPVVAQRMGSNPEVIDDGVTGFLVQTQEEWYDRLRLLVEDSELRRRMGAAARAAAVERFSVEAQMPRVASVFDQAVRAGPSARVSRARATS